jgi:hypothetical protein
MSTHGLLFVNVVGLNGRNRCKTSATTLLRTRPFQHKADARGEATTWFESLPLRAKASVEFFDP